MKKYILYIIVSIFMMACSSGHKPKQTQILVYCASSLTNVVSEIAKEFESEVGIKVKLNFASSGTLARQIEHGAKPSLFISANKKWVTYLNDLELTNPKLEKQIASNSLVVIAPKESTLKSFSFNNEIDFPEIFTGRLSIGDPKHVPAGEYAWQAITKLGLQNKLEKRLLPAKDVRSALMVVELAETQLGIVYKTDAMESEKVKILAEIPNNLHDTISYYLSVLDENDKNAKLFYAYLRSDTSKKRWIKNGFNIE